MLFSDLYLAKFFNTSAKSFFPYLSISRGLTADGDINNELKFSIIG